MSGLRPECLSLDMAWNFSKKTTNFVCSKDVLLSCILGTLPIVILCRAPKNHPTSSLRLLGHSLKAVTSTSHLSSNPIHEYCKITQGRGSFLLLLSEKPTPTVLGVSPAVLAVSSFLWSAAPFSPLKPCVKAYMKILINTALYTSQSWNTSLHQS